MTSHLYFSLFIIIAVTSAEIIYNLPGLPRNTRIEQFSGYARTSETHFLHYWFVKAETDSLSKPVMLWMNGGPGCSSLVGYLAEIGPYLISRDGKTLSVNPFSWHKFVNIIFLEAPAGVGYSYSTDGNTTTDDDQTSFENYKALEYIFMKEFPKYRKNDFYIAGQSYGGIYAPTLAKRVIDGYDKLPLKLKGVLVGNGILDGSLMVNTFFQFARLHGLVPEKNWMHFKSACCGCGNTAECDFTRHIDGDACSSEFHEFYGKLIVEDKINPYDVNANCFDATNITDEYSYLDSFFDKFPAEMVPSLKEFIRNKLEQKKLKHRRFLGNYPCWDDRAIRGYLSQKSVRKALHIPDKAAEWDTCRDWPEGQQYVMNYFWVSRSDIIKQIVNFGAQVLLYYGDADMACNFFHAEQFARNLNLDVIRDKTAWFYKNQCAGFLTIYKGLYMATIKGAGHMSPADRRPQTFDLVKGFITDK